MSGKAVRETLGFLAVVAGLVFVGLEIQQNTVATRAATRQALAEASISNLQGLYSDAELNRQLWDWGEAEEGTVPDCRETRMCVFVLAALRHHENVYLQVQEGFLDESAFLSYGYGSQGLYLSAHFRARWLEMRGQMHPDFVAAFEAEYDLAP